MADSLNDNLIKICKYWNDRKDELTAWETKDGRVAFHVVIQYVGRHNAYLVFKEKVGQPQAKSVLDPILKQLDQNNKDGTCKQFPTAVDLTKLNAILDADKTKEANK